MMTYAMTRPKAELTIYRVTGGHANHSTNPTRSWFLS